MHVLRSGITTTGTIGTIKMPNRLHSMARFAEPDEPRQEFICGACGYAFDMPRDSDDAHACDCGLDLCPDCRTCQPCRKLADAELEEKLREQDEQNLRNELTTRNRLVCYLLGIV